MRLFRSLIVCLCCVLSIGTQTFAREVDPLFGDTIDRTAEDFVTVSLLIAEPGEILYSSFGHAMLHLQCPAFNLDYVFTYESEPIRENWGRFLQGDLKMGMFAIPFDTMLRPYREEGRGVVEYSLNLSSSQEQKLWQVMDELVAKGPNRPYDYYNHGCALSVVHVIKKAIEGKQIQYGTWPEKFDGTMRELGYACVTNSGHLWNRFALMTLAGSDIDDPHIAHERKLIVPADLAEVWQQATLEGKPLLENTPRVLVESRMHMQKGLFTPLWVAFLILFLALFSLAVVWIPEKGWYIAGEVVDYSILLIVSVIGAVVVYTVLVSTLPCTQWNWLIIPFNVMPAIGWYWRKYWALPWAIVLSIWCAVMTGEWIWGHILVDWAHIILTMAFVVVLLKQWLIAHRTSHKQGR